MKHLVMSLVFVVGVSFLITYCLIPLIRYLALKFNILDLPDGKIKCHQAPVPYLGGLAVYLGLTGAFLLSGSLDYAALWLFIGITLLLAIGLIDDFMVLRPLQKFVGQFFVALFLLKNGFSCKTADYVHAVISGFWMLSVINAFNLIDVMDGLASIVAIVAALAFAVIAVTTGDLLVGFLLAALLGAIGAFFCYNKPAAKIYLGDAGSLCLGGFFAAIPSFLIRNGFSSYDFYFISSIILAVPLIEVFCLIIIRTRLGIPFYKGSPHHFAIYLQQKGWGKWSVLCFAGLMGFVVAGIGIAHFLGVFSLITTIITCMVVALVWYGLVFTSAFKVKVGKNS